MKDEKLLFTRKIDGHEGIDGIVDVNTMMCLAVCNEANANRFIEADRIVRLLAENNKDESQEDGLNKFTQLMIDADMYVLNNPLTPTNRERHEK